MKKISKQALKWSQRSSLAEAFREKRISGVRKHKLALRSRTLHFSTTKIRLPNIVSLGSPEDRSKLITFIKRLKDALNDKTISNVTINFSSVSSLHPCGTLLLLAEIDRIMESATRSKKISAVYPKDQIVEEMFQHVGLLSLLGLEPRIPTISSLNVKPWLYATGHDGDLDSIAEKLPKILTEGKNMELRLALLSGMAEAVANSSEHAYPKLQVTPIPGTAPKKWWLFARQFGDDVAVAICDLGRGIPGTLEANWTEEVSHFLKTRRGLKRQDHKMIELALTVGRTSTKKINRGKGLKDILKVVREQHVGVLSIYSNHGVYTLNNSTASDVSLDEKNSIHGTIIQWKIPIEAFGLEGSERS
ncbi:hypothetical protein V2K22_04285 [Pseudomonas alliivorans]|nr:hypothetical protein [Pseudomonas alliivorans]